MRWHFKKKKKTYDFKHGSIAYVDHPIFKKCTLYTKEIDGTTYGLAVIQQRMDRQKKTYWTEIDWWLVDEIYENPLFPEYFVQRAKPIDEKDRFYPVVTVRQIMWALKMKPLTKQRWETTFDRKEI